MRYKYFALDIDGTVFSSEEIIYPVYKEAIEKFASSQSQQIEIPGRERIMLEIGKPVKVIFENLFPEMPYKDRDQISDSILRLLCEKIDNGMGDYYPDVTKTIEEIVSRGAKILVASNGRPPYIEAILRKLNVLQHVVYPTYIEGKSIFSKSDIMRSYVARGLDSREILMVGDRSSDLEAALAIDGDFAWCAYGHAPPGEIKQFTIRLEMFSDLLAYA
jgi:phosphoglycolate phosphatase